MRMQKTNMEKDMNDLKAELRELTSKFQKLQLMEAAFNAEIDKIKQKYIALEKEMEEVTQRLSDEQMLRSRIQTILARNKKDVEDLDSTLSCLSCLEYLQEPLVLICGHSICRSCFNTHSDPNSKDSLVFCEECKIETKNKMLKDQPVMTLICDRYGK